MTLATKQCNQCGRAFFVEPFRRSEARKKRETENTQQMPAMPSGEVLPMEANEKSIVLRQAIVYARFSPRPDADTSKSNEKQIDRCRAYCERQGYAVVGVFCDAAVSGKHLSRPGLSDAIAALGAGMVLVVDTADRLARDMLVALTLHSQIEQRGAIVEAADGSPNRSTPEGELFSDILAAFAAYERKRFARRTKAGLARKRAAGQHCGRTPYGWAIGESKKLVHDPGEQANILLIVKMKDKGWNSETITATMRRLGRQCRGKPWTARTVRKILSRESKK